ncbi:MAG: hypothetical protein JWM92_589 [Candidatus Nomurabacteria bacterium]|nr:hypothetical protein [Candidatus Nomurabacteria bacterium]
MIISRLSGGMGNQMFQYALGRKLSLQYNVPLKLDTTFLLHRESFPSLLRPHFVFRNYDLDVFKVAATIATADDMKWWQRPILSGKIMLVIDALLRKVRILRGWEKSFTFDSRILSLGPDVYLAGFWQSYKYFDSIRSTLLEDFTLIKPLSEASEKLRIEIKNCNSVCVHVRRSDIAHKSFHGTIGKGYYDVALQYIALHETIEKVYVFSDDIAWCKDNMQFSFPTTYVGPEYAGQKGEENLMLMTVCKHFIIPNSTFSWWAAWLSTTSNKIVIAPKQWFSGRIDTTDLIPETWMRL